MKRVIPLALALLLLLTACAPVPVAEQNKAIVGGLTLGTNSGYSDGPENRLDCTVYGVSGQSCLEFLDEKLFSYVFVSQPGTGDPQGDYDKLLAGLTGEYGKPSASDQENHVVQWGGSKLGVTVVLTGHLAETDPYSSFTVAGKWDTLVGLGVVKPAVSWEFDLFGRLLDLQSATADGVLADWGTPKSDTDFQNGKRVMEYGDQQCEGVSGTVYLSFFNGTLYSAAFSANTREDAGADNGFFWNLYARFTAAYDTPGDQYTLGYAVKGENADHYSPAQTQYAVWQKKTPGFALELVRAANVDGQSVQFSLTSNWILKDKEALDILTAEDSAPPQTN